MSKHIKQEVHQLVVPHPLPKIERKKCKQHCLLNDRPITTCKKIRPDIKSAHMAIVIEW